MGVLDGKVVYCPISLGMSCGVLPASAELTMTDTKRALADALSSNRALRNQVHQIEQPLLTRIRELEVERDTALASASAARTETERYKSAVAAMIGLLHHLLSTGKP